MANHVWGERIEEPLDGGSEDVIDHEIYWL